MPELKDATEPPLWKVIANAAVCAAVGASIAGAFHIFGIHKWLTTDIGLTYGLYPAIGAAFGALLAYAPYVHLNTPEARHRRAERQYRDAGFSPEQARALAELQIKQENQKIF